MTAFARSRHPLTGILLIALCALPAEARPDDRDRGLPFPPGGAPLATKASALLGTWSGDMKEAVGAGEVVSYPLSITITQTTPGAFHVDIRVDANVKMRAGTTSLMVHHRMRGTMRGNTLVAQGYEKRVRVNGSERAEAPDQGEFTVVGGRLRGKFGKPASQNSPARWSTVDFRKAAGTQPVVVSPPFKRIDVVGRWAGKLSEQLEDGTKLTYPARIHVGPNKDGSGHPVRITMKMKYPVKGVETTVAIEHEMIGTYNEDRLTCKGLSKVVRVNGKASQEAPEEALMRVVDGRLVGRFGYGHLGWSSFRFQRETGALDAPTIERGTGLPSTGPGTTDAPSSRETDLHGTWAGTMQETLPSGERVSYPVHITVDRPNALGIYTIKLVIEANIRDAQGASQNVVIEQVMRGPRARNTINAKGMSKFIVEGGVRREDTPDNGEFERLDDGSLRGRFGTDAEGWSAFHYEPGTTNGSTSSLPASMYVGAWQGMLTEVGEDGSKRTVPVTLSIVRSQEGNGLSITMRVQSSVKGANGPLPQTVIESFEGQEIDGGIQARGVKKSVTIDGKPENATLDTLTLAYQNDRLAGRVGNDIEGYNTLSMRNVGGGAIDGAQAATENFAGTWRGEVRETIDGRPVTYPIALIVTKTSTGYSVQMGAEAQVPNRQGKTQVIEIRETFTGSASLGVLRLQGTRKDMHVDGVRQDVQVDRAELRFQQGALVGELGNDLEGMVPVRLVKQ